MSLRDDIFAAKDLPPEPVPTPEWGTEIDGQVYARGLGADERDDWETFMANHSEPDGDSDNRRRMRPGTRGIRAKLVAMGACDEDGDAIFSQEDVTRLGQKSARVLDRLYDKIRAQSGMSDEDEGKNSLPGSDSSTDLPLDSDAPSENCSVA